MEIQTLTGKWQLRQVGNDEWLPATVPGGVHTDLLDLGLIPDPFFGDNEKKVMWVAEKDWEYTKIFTPTAELLAENKVFLVADGLDTLTKVSLNGKPLGETNNQFRQYRWNVKDLLIEGENRLEIYFSGPSTYAAAEQKRRRMKGVEAAIDGGPHLRKAPCQFGWDWGPMLPPIGIWQDVRLEGRSIARLSDVHIQQFHENGVVTVQAGIKVEAWMAGKLSAKVQMISPSGEIINEVGWVSGDSITLKTRIENPQLWWTNGLGEQNLYDVEIILKNEDILLDTKEVKVGLRTLELRQEVRS